MTLMKEVLSLARRAKGGRCRGSGPARIGRRYSLSGARRASEIRCWANSAELRLADLFRRSVLGPFWMTLPMGIARKPAANPCRGPLDDRHRSAIPAFAEPSTVRSEQGVARRTMLSRG